MNPFSYLQEAFKMFKCFELNKNMYNYSKPVIQVSFLKLGLPITLCTKGFCWSSGSDMNSSTDKDPELSRSSFLNLENKVYNKIKLIKF